MQFNVRTSRERRGLIDGDESNLRLRDIVQLVVGVRNLSVVGAQYWSTDSYHAAGGDTGVDTVIDIAVFGATVSSAAAETCGSPPETSSGP